MGVKTIDEYLGGVSPEQRVALESLRAQVKAAAPETEEGVCLTRGRVLNPGLMIRTGVPPVWWTG